jgi:hypothetical protein
VVERRHALINSKGGIKACFDELSKSYDNVNKNFNKLEGYMNDIHQYSDEISYLDIVDGYDINYIKGVYERRSKCIKDFEYIDDIIESYFGKTSKKLVLID